MERRHLWVAVVLFGGAALLAMSLFSGLEGPVRISYRIAIPLFVAMGVLVATRTLSADTGILIALVVGTGLFLHRLAGLQGTASHDLGALAHMAFRGITLLSGAAFIALGPRRGLALSGLMWAAGVAILLVGPVPIQQPSSIGQGVGEVAATSAVVILMFRLLSSSVVQAQVQAEVAQSSAELAYIDDLTGLPNRRQMTVHLGAAVARAMEGGGPDSLVMFDLDRFKAINDTLGHEEGDVVLRRTATVASSTLREGDVLGRWGGEEFMVLLSEADEEEAAAIAERCRVALEAVQGRTAVTASFGVTRVDRADTIIDALRRADLALYAAKARGRNRVVVRPPETPRYS